MNRREYMTARRSLRKEFSHTLTIAGAALRQRLKKAARRNGLDRQSLHYEVRIRKNIYLHLRRSLKNRFYVRACASLVVRNPSAFVEKMLERIDALDKEVVSFPMTARDWLQV